MNCQRSEIYKLKKFKSKELHDFVKSFHSSFAIFRVKLMKSHWRAAKIFANRSDVLVKYLCSSEQSKSFIVFRTGANRQKLGEIKFVSFWKLNYLWRKWQNLSWHLLLSSLCPHNIICSVLQRITIFVWFILPTESASLLDREMNYDYLQSLRLLS